MWWFLKGQNAAQLTRPLTRVLKRKSSCWRRFQNLEALAGHDIAIKVWLPELVARTLKW